MIDVLSIKVSRSEVTEDQSANAASDQGMPTNTVISVHSMSTMCKLTNELDYTDCMRDERSAASLEQNDCGF